MEERTEKKHFLHSLTWLQATLIVFLGAAGFFLLTEHRAHVLGTLPFLIFLLCPLMHIFMHKGHRGHHGSGGREHNQKIE
jgi:hypothetical protein